MRRTPATRPARQAIAVLLVSLLALAATLAVASSSSSSTPRRIPYPVAAAIELAGATYGHEAELWRKARCETGGTYNPRSYNRRSGAAGLFQFLPSTWATTPYSGADVMNPYASALAAGWMHAHGRGGEWVCR